MRISWWACIFVGVLTCSAAYFHFNQPLLPTESVGAAKQSDRPPFDQKPGQPFAHTDGSRLEPDQLTHAQKEARLEDATGSITTEYSELNEPTQNLSYLTYYAYSELPPETKPADTVLSSLKDIPPGTPVEEIRRVAGVLGLDVTFMKTIAKIESGFNPKSKTGSYLGLFQLSKYEFGKYGSGDIFGSRENTVAAALKMSTEDILFEMYTHRKPTFYDRYLIHQQGIEGAAEHLNHPNRLAWRSMCATGEGKEKGEKWCKRAIWGNTLPALKKAWKNVNKVTSAAFVAMWQQRVSHFTRDILKPRRTDEAVPS